MKKENPDKELEELIQVIFDENDKNYGYRRIYLELRNKGHKVNHKKIQDSTYHEEVRANGKEILEKNT